MVTWKCKCEAEFTGEFLRPDWQVIKIWGALTNGEKTVESKAYRCPECCAKAEQRKRMLAHNRSHKKATESTHPKQMGFGDLD